MVLEGLGRMMDAELSRRTGIKHGTFDDILGPLPPEPRPAAGPGEEGETPRGGGEDRGKRRAEEPPTDHPPRRTRSVHSPVHQLG